MTRKTKTSLFLLVNTIIFTSLIYINLDSFKASTAFAVGDINVDWGVPAGDPIFNYPNISPGFQAEKTVIINNLAPNSRKVGIKVFRTSSTDLSDLIEVTILKNGNEIYSTRPLITLIEDSNQINGTFLLELQPSEVANLTIILKLSNAIEQERMLTNFIFDIHFGIIDGENNGVPADCNFPLNGKVIYGTSKRDVLSGTSGNDLIIGFEGSDILKGLGGRDCIIGGEGNDLLDGHDEADVLIDEAGENKFNGGSGNDIMSGGKGSEKFDGNEGNDKIFAQGGNDSINGGTGDDIIYGDDGNDTIDGNNGKDLIFGGQGNDKINGSNDDDTLWGNEGIDTIDGDTGFDKCSGENVKKCEANLTAPI